MTLYNVTETLVRITLDDAYVTTGRLKCVCQQCQDDILALALNRLPVRYVSTDKGHAYVKVQYFDSQTQSDVFRELAHASQIVSEHPRHRQQAPEAESQV